MKTDYPYTSELADALAATAQVRRRLASLLHDHDLTITEWLILSFLTGGYRLPRDVAAYLGQTSALVSMTTPKLLKRGLIFVGKGTNKDGRLKNLRATLAGEEIIAAIEVELPALEGGDAS